MLIEKASSTNKESLDSVHEVMKTSSSSSHLAVSPSN